MRGNWKKRLGVCGGLTLLFLTVMPVLPASAAPATFIVRVIVDNGSAGTALRSDFQYSIDGGPATNFPTTGVVSFVLDDATPHSAAPVDFPGYTATVTPTCTNVTLDARHADRLHDHGDVHRADHHHRIHHDAAADIDDSSGSRDPPGSRLLQRHQQVQVAPGAGAPA